jgi:hypothetical protein
LCDDKGIGARSPGDELVAPPAKEGAALSRLFVWAVLVDGHDVELWQLDRKIETFRHTVKK